MGLSWYGLGALTALEGKVDVNCNFMVLGDHFHPMKNYLFPAEWGVFEYDNAPVHRARVSQRFEEHSTDYIVIYML